MVDTSPTGQVLGPSGFPVDTSEANSGIGGANPVITTMVTPPTADLPAIPPLKIPAAIQAAQAYQDSMMLAKSPRSCSPMDELPWFISPLSSTFVLGGVPDVIVAVSNPQRVGIIFTHTANFGGDVFLGVGSPINVAAPSGLRIGSTMMPLQLLQKDWGNLVSQEFHGWSTVAGTRLHVLEIVLRDWPKR